MPRFKLQTPERKPKGKDDTCKLAAALIEQGWVDPRNVVIWGVTLVEWRDWNREKVGADWVVDDGAQG